MAVHAFWPFATMIRPSDRHQAAGTAGKSRRRAANRAAARSRRRNRR